MAIQLSAATWFMNNEIWNIIEDSRKEYYLKEGDKERLAELRQEYYNLTENSYFERDSNAVVNSPNAHLRGLNREIVVTSKDERIYPLFEEVANILKKNLIPVHIYQKLENVFGKMRREPTLDTKKTLEHASKIMRSGRFNHSNRISWNLLKRLGKVN